MKRSPIIPPQASNQARRIERPRSMDRPILFGTSGWRGRLGEEVTFPRLHILVRSVADWILEQSRGRDVLIGWDSRYREPCDGRVGRRHPR